MLQRLGTVLPVYMYREHFLHFVVGKCFTGTDTGFGTMEHNSGSKKLSTKYNSIETILTKHAPLKTHPWNTGPYIHIPFHTGFTHIF